MKKRNHYSQSQVRKQEMAKNRKISLIRRSIMILLSQMKINLRRTSQLLILSQNYLMIIIRLRMSELM